MYIVTMFYAYVLCSIYVLFCTKVTTQIIIQGRISYIIKF